MNVEFIVCPTCKQKLAVQSYIAVDSHIVCANPGCNTSLRITGRKPITVEKVAMKDTFTPDYRPESYG